MWSSWQEITLWGISVFEIVMVVIILLGVLLISGFFAHLVIKLIEKLVLTTQTSLDNEILATLRTPLKFIFVATAIYFTIEYLNPSLQASEWLSQITRSFVIFTVFWIIYRVMTPLSLFFEKIAGLMGDVDQELVHALRDLLFRIIKLLIVFTGLATLLYEWDINITGLFIHMGIAGSVVAFAAKDTLANFFGSFVIILDRAFKKGDWIMTPDIEGIVEEIGSRVTKVRTFSKALVTVPNANLANAPITNWSKMSNRRIKMNLGLKYGTSRVQVEHIIQRIKDYLHQHPNIETDPEKVVTLVHLTEFGQSSINILLYYFTKTTKWRGWMLIKEENMLEFMKIVEEEGAAFAFNSHSIYIEKLPTEEFKKML